ncbi:spore coat protein U-like protein [Silvimonas terrae]|uniref:Spore coat protein U-like protein n=1 Tax=Silvimonas terrae TaxID=300266 RepID=A0A840RM75_9NEIS|nr:spore coat U domain-containing protein [Silvimonas terrae]MBB5193201.1 spore coat protein U-like protein [Silvimonas terrae]
MSLLKNLGRLLLAGMFMASAATTWAAAACQASNGTGSLGTTISSFSVYNAQQSTTATSGIKCTGSLVSLLGTNVVTVTIANSANKTGTQARLLNTTTGADYVPYIICKDSSCGTVYNVGSSITWSSTSLLGLLGLFNNSDGSLPLYIRTMTGARVAAGNYTDTLTLNWTWQLCDLGVGGLCLVITGSGTSTVGLSMGVVNDCVLTAPNVLFGVAPLANGFADVNQVVQVVCTKGASYTVGMSNGNNWSGTVRQMKSTAGGFLQYDIYKPDSTRWGPTGTDRRSSSAADANAGTYDGVTTQGYNYRASVIQTQTTPATGAYTDLITLDILF